MLDIPIEPKDSALALINRQMLLNNLIALAVEPQQVVPRYCQATGWWF